MLKPQEDESYWRVLCLDLLAVIDGLLGEDATKAFKCRTIAFEMLERAKNGEYS